MIRFVRAIRFWRSSRQHPRGSIPDLTSLLHRLNSTNFLAIISHRNPDRSILLSDRDLGFADRPRVSIRSETHRGRGKGGGESCAKDIENGRWKKEVKKVARSRPVDTRRRMGWKREGNETKRRCQLTDALSPPWRGEIERGMRAIKGEETRRKGKRSSGCLGCLHSSTVANEGSNFLGKVQASRYWCVKRAAIIRRVIIQD